MRLRSRAASLALVAGLSLAPALAACGDEDDDPDVEQRDGGEEDGNGY